MIIKSTISSFRNSVIVLLIALSSSLANSSYAQNCYFEIDSIAFINENCEIPIRTCIDVPYFAFLNSSVFLNGVDYDFQPVGCDYQQIGAYSYASLFGNGTDGPYLLNTWIFNGTMYNAQFNKISELVDSMNVWDPTGNWALDPFTELLIGGDISNDYGNMTIFTLQFNPPIPFSSGYNIGSYPYGTEIGVVGSGVNEFIIIDALHSCTDTLYIKIDCPLSVTDTINVAVGDTISYCMQLNGFGTPITSILNNCPLSQNGNANIQINAPDTCLSLVGLEIGTDTICLQICNSLGACIDQNYLINVYSQNIGTHLVYDTLHVLEQNSFCIDTSSFTNNIVYVNDCSTVNNNVISYSIDSTNYCINYSSEATLGNDTICYSICDSYGVCDTTQIVIIVVNSEHFDVLTDTILVGEAFEYCFDTTGLQQPFLIQNYCANPSDSTFIINSTSGNCIQGVGNSEGLSQNCFVLTDNNGVSDTVIIKIATYQGNYNTVADTLIVGDSLIYCIDTTHLINNVTFYNNLCDLGDSQMLHYTLNEQSWCIQLNADSAGVDSVCMVICNSFNLCDTTIFILTVNEFVPQINAIDDIDSTLQNMPLSINPILNDSLFGSIATIRLLTDELGGKSADFGQTVLQNDNTISYIPNVDLCDVIDTFAYEICVAQICDTAFIQVYIECDSDTTSTDTLIIYNGFSPNDDARNDVFYIEGIENHPNNELWIYNRWGNLVFHTQNYQNDWKGKWNDKILTDGTFFYIFNYDDVKKHGYIQIHR